MQFSTDIPSQQQIEALPHDDFIDCGGLDCLATDSLSVLADRVRILDDTRDISAVKAVRKDLKEFWLIATETARARASGKVSDQQVATLTTRLVIAFRILNNSEVLAVQARDDLANLRLAISAMILADPILSIGVSELGKTDDYNDALYLYQLGYELEQIMAFRLDEETEAHYKARLYPGQDTVVDDSFSRPVPLEEQACDELQIAVNHVHFAANDVGLFGDFITFQNVAEQASYLMLQICKLRLELDKYKAQDRSEVELGDDRYGEIIRYLHKVELKLRAAIKICTNRFLFEEVSSCIDKVLYAGDYLTLCNERERAFTAVELEPLALGADVVPPDYMAGFVLNQYAPPVRLQIQQDLYQQQGQPNMIAVGDDVDPADAVAIVEALNSDDGPAAAQAFAFQQQGDGWQNPADFPTEDANSYDDEPRPTDAQLVDMGILDQDQAEPEPQQQPAPPSRPASPRSSYHSAVEGPQSKPASPRISYHSDDPNSEATLLDVEKTQKSYWLIPAILAAAAASAGLGYLPAAINLTANGLSVVTLGAIFAVSFATVAIAAISAVYFGTKAAAESDAEYRSAGAHEPAIINSEFSIESAATMLIYRSELGASRDAAIHARSTDVQLPDPTDRSRAAAISTSL